MSPGRPDSSLEHLDIVLASLPEDGVLLELGSGWSTPYFAENLVAEQTLVSVEHDEDWFYKVMPTVVHDERVEILLKVPECDVGPYGTHHRENPVGAANFIHAVDFSSVDTVFIDGLARGACLVAAGIGLRGGNIFLHDAERPWYNWAVEIVDEFAVAVTRHPPGQGHPAEMLQCLIA